MTSTYARVMTGGKIVSPPVGRHWVYLLIVVMFSAMVAMAPSQTWSLISEPAGIAALIAVAAGFLVQRSMALTPWGFVSASVALYAVAGLVPSLRPWSLAAQTLTLAGAVTVAIVQVRVDLTSGENSRRAPRTRWGSVLVATTAVLTVVVLGFSDLPLVDLIRSDPTGNGRTDAMILKAEYSAAVTVGRVADPSLNELSGLAASTINPGLMWAHNDSGHDPSIYCLEQSGVSCGVWNLTGASSQDWEDIAIGPGPDPGTSYLYVGDIGDNVGRLAEITVYRTPEPRVGTATRTSTADLPQPTEPAESIRFRYPDGAHDAEALMVHPQSGDVYIITKEAVSGVYRATAPLDPSKTTTLERVARFSIFATLSDRTGGAISPDGRRVALSTYGGAFELALPSVGSAGFDSIWDRTPSRIEVPNPGQLEAITYSRNGRALWLVPEGAHSPVFRAQLLRPGGGS